MRVSEPPEDTPMEKVTKKKPKLKKGVQIVLVDLPEPHRGNIPRDEIQRAVRKVISERLQREAEEEARAKAEARARKRKGNASEAT
jgi:hypothetical protein